MNAASPSPDNQTLAQRGQTARQVRMLAAASLLTAVLLALFYIPYYLFPSDDVEFVSAAIEKRITPFTITTQVYIPVHTILMGLFGRIWSLFSHDWPSICGLSTAVFAAATGLFSSLLVLRLTRNVIWSLAAIILIAASGWTTNYGFHYQYTVPATAMLMAAIYFYVTWEMDGERAALPGILSGVSFGLYFWTSSSAAFTLCVVVPCLLLLAIPFRRERWRAFAMPITAALAVFLLFAVRGIPSLLLHIKEARYSPHDADAQAVLGYVPRPPFFVFFRILCHYNPVLFVILLALCIGWIVCMARAVMSGRRQAGMASMQFRVPAVFLLLVVLHGVALDVQPLQKLARSSYPMLPLLFVSGLVSLYMLIQRSGRLRNVMTAAAVLLLASVLWKDVRYSHDVEWVRRGLRQYLDRNYPGRTFYAMEGDSHARKYPMLLLYRGGEIVLDANLSRLPEMETNGVLLVGPHGPGSGLSILQHSTLPDFILPPVAAVLNSPPFVRKAVLPYYAYFPSFILDEDISQALYFSGKTPDWHSTNLQVWVYTWN